LVRRPWLAFVARTQSQGVAVERVGVVDLRTGGVQLTPVPAARRRELAILPGSESSPVLVRDDVGAWSQVVDGHLAPMRSPVPRALAPRLVLAEDRATLVRHPVPGVLADWDQLQMASALRIQRSNRVITVPAPALIDGQRLAFAPGAAHLALVAGLDACDRKAVPGASPQGPFRAYVVDAIAGVPRQVAQSERGLEVEWIDERTLAVGSERGVLLIDVAALDGEPAQEEPQAAGLAQRAGAVELAEVALPAAGRHSKCQEPTEPPQSEDLDEL
ncbi:MAG TPA: hypothetical protein PKU97_12885, partial [Kofleriaceae bacterium]|nr:hypothetical protein [Kofleriaceae bacterium]